MRSAARLAYEQLQEAADSGTNAGLPPELIGNLYGAFRALLAAREARGTLDLELPERQVVLDARGHVAEVVPRPPPASHRRIEGFLGPADRAAGQELERRQAPGNDRG